MVGKCPYGLNTLKAVHHHTSLTCRRLGNDFLDGFSISSVLIGES